MTDRRFGRSLPRLPRGALALASCAWALAACGAAPTPGTPAPGGTSAPGVAAPVPPPVDVAALSAEVEQRGRAALPGGDLGAVFAGKGNVVISPFGLGLTRVAAEAVLAPTLDEARRFVPLTHSTASCSGAVWFHHRLLFNRAVPVRDEGDKLAWALSPGQHLGFEEPASSQRCVQVYSPLDRIEGQPSSKPMLRVEELDIPAPRIELSGARLGLSRVNAQVRFPVCRTVTPAFQGCDAKPADSSALRPGLLDPPGPAPLGMEVRAEAQVVKEGGVTIVALTLDALGVPASVQRKQSLVLALPEAVCEGAPRPPSPELIAAMKRAAVAPRATAVRLLLPEIETSTLLAAGAPAPLDGLLVSATMRTLSCQASPAAPLPEGVTTIAANRPFYYAIIDEATQTLLLLGRFDELTRFERRSPLGIPPDMAAPPRGQGGVAPLK